MKAIGGMFQEAGRLLGYVPFFLPSDGCASGQRASSVELGFVCCQRGWLFAPPPPSPPPPPPPPLSADELLGLMRATSDGATAAAAACGARSAR